MPAIKNMGQQTTREDYVAYLVFRNAKSRSARNLAWNFKLSRSTESIVGRINEDRPPTFPIDDPRLMRQHCRIMWSEGDNHFMLEDLDSHCGTRLNARLIARPIALANLDVIRIGITELIYVEFYGD